jgi:hypothetical protein
MGTKIKEEEVREKVGKKKIKEKFKVERVI